ncbi:MAG: NAD-glutamate dehydrogenase [Candidatus Binatia bacterium]
MARAARPHRARGRGGRVGGQRRADGAGGARRAPGGTRRRARGDAHRRRRHRPLRATAEVYGELAAGLELDWLRRALPAALSSEERWEARAAAGLLDQLRAIRRRLTRAVLAEPTPVETAAERVAAFNGARRDQVDTIVGLCQDLRATPRPPLPALLVLLREVDRLAEGAAGGRP